MTDDVPGTHWQTEDGLHVDTRGLAPPDPLVAVLWHISRPNQSGPVFAYFDRDPIFLFPELAERGWAFEYGSPDGDEVRLTLRRDP